MGPGSQLALAHVQDRARARADPLARFRCSVWAMRSLIEALSATPPHEVLWLAGNSGAKTTSGMAVDLAFLQGRDRIVDRDGSEIRLPVIQPPVAWVLGIPSYKIGGASSVGKLRELLGGWDYHEARAGGEDQVSTFSIRHRLDPPERERWSSKLYVFPYEGVVPEAMRLDGWHCDEPPPYRFLDALRNRGKAGRPLRGFLTMTPIERKLWEPILADFPREHAKARNGRVRLQSSLYDNKALSPADIARAEAAVQSSPWRLARLYGEPVDIAGTCPFDVENLIAQREKAEDGTRYAAGWAHRDGRDVMWPQQHAKGEIEVWAWPERGDRAIIVADPSSGVRDPDKIDSLQPRNPSGLAVGSLAHQRLLVRFNGYVRAHELGLMAKALCNKCPDWVMVHETSGGWGDAFLQGFRESPSTTRGELWFERDPVTGKPVADPGWRQTSTRRGALLSALQRAIESKGLAIPSRSALDNLLQVRLDENERWDHGDGRGPHGEDVITLGIMAYVMERSTLPRIQDGERRFGSEDFARMTHQNGGGGNGAIQERW